MISKLADTIALLFVYTVVHTLPEGEPVRGVTSLAGKIYLLRNKERDQIEVYDSINYSLQRCLTVPNSRAFADMTSCEHYRCLYVADPDVNCIHRLGSQGSTVTRWAVNDEPRGVSVNAERNLMVTCDEVRKIKELSCTHGDIVREIRLPDDVCSPWHAIQVSSGQLIVCHGNLDKVDDAVRRVCMMSVDGLHIVHSHGGQRGSDTGQYDGPVHLAVDGDESVFVADFANRRVTLFSSTLTFVRHVMSSSELKWCPTRLSLDTKSCTRRLYVADNEWTDDRWTTGRVVVFSF